MRRIVLTIFFILSMQVIYAQHTISGLITDLKDNSLLLEGVTVYVPEFEKIDQSKEGGTYIVRGVGVGMVHVQFSKTGYRTVVKIVNTTDSAAVVNVEMQKDGGKSDVMTSTTSFMQLPQNTPYPVVQFDGDRLRRMGNIKFLSSLIYEPGVDAITIGNISKPVIRGLSGNHILMVQSGSRILSNRLDERYDYELVDNGTSEVELVKGPAALLYGDNAMGGVLIFKDEKMPAPGRVVGDVNLSFSTSTFGLRSDAGVKGSATNGLFYSVRLGGSSHTSYVQGEGFEQKKNTEVRKFAYNSGSVAADAKGIVGISRKWGESKLTVTYWKKQSELIQSFSQSEIDTMGDSNERDRKTMTPFIDQESTMLSSQNTLFAGKGKIEANISWQSYSRDGSYSTSAINYDVKYTTNPLRKSGFSVGSQGYFQNKDYAAYYSIFQNKLLSNSLYALYRYDLEKFNILVGGRYDSKKLTTPNSSLDQDYNFINGSAGVAYHPTEDITVKLNGATGNSVPDEERYYYNHMYYGYLTSYDVKEEMNREGDLGFEWRHSFLTINLDAFYNKISDYTFIDSVYGSTDQFVLRQEDATINGGEAKVFIHPQQLEWLNINLGYSMLNGQFDSSKLDMPRIPGNKFIAGVRFQSKRMNYLYNSYVEIMMRSYSKQEKIFTTETKSEGYTLLDLRVGGSFHWGMQAFDITVAVNNILDTEYYSHLSLTKNIEPVPVTDMGRNVSIMFRFPFGLSSGK